MWKFIEPCETIERLFADQKETPYRNYLEEIDMEEQENDDGTVRKGIGRKDGDEMDAMVEGVQCMTLRKPPETTKRGEEISWGKYGLWRQGQKTIAARLANQLKARWELEEVTEEELNKFCSHYNCSTVPAQLKDVALFFMPRRTPSHELAALSWLGDWRPSAILELIRGLARSPSSFISDSSGIEQLISHVIHEIRIEETIIDEEMAEIQATCILHLPFSRLKKKQSGGSSLGFIQEEFKKIERVITKAQQLRFKALELVVKKVLNQTDAAAFFVAFTGIQDAIHQVAEQQKLEPVTVPTKTSR
ncbi:hypothetical protein EZV62_004315 [Acer yangbiense]|uniref:DOG1 domain-containing protein n=1 Tax=Acer yangbiense TaxID=1000413 RepID=A0A5C7IJH8_9ROSI|nr:hypothetical protein EZV62_004315 [Acer yangbiense]